MPRDRDSVTDAPKQKLVAVIDVMKESNKTHTIL